MSMVLHRVGPVSCAKITGALYLVLGLIIGAFFSLAAMAGGFASNSSQGAGLGALIGVGAIVFFPLLYGCIGFVSTLFFAWVYNVLAGIVGGIEMDLH
jgi:hypothetical protein